ncbi:hypothetical protein TWF706_008304 [Orbilia oligospora]|uniref:Uncharacterized protein n=1 Tax=Orbilia oligospora TaxID=2813651 RepID=A0A7C8PC52_ORBOL|nr:hypothetical protein TWF706_008304 [Orbilia oligospora]KAF3146057.1 hypothetical protein TWF703_005603 [Orbilia oligospora]
MASIHNLKCDITVVSRGQNRLFSSTPPEIATSEQTMMLFEETLYQHYLFAHLLYDVTISVGKVEVLGVGANASYPLDNLPVRIVDSEECPHLTAAFRGQIPFPDAVDLWGMHRMYIHDMAPQSRTRYTFIMALVINQRKMLCWILFGIAASLVCGTLVGCITKKAEVGLGVVVILFEMMNLARGYI